MGIHKIEGPGSAGTLHGAETIRLELVDYDRGDAEAQALRNKWREHFSAPNSMRRTAAAFSLAPPPAESLNKHLWRGRRICALRDLGVTVTETGTIMLPLYLRGPGALEVQPWRGWVKTYVPNPAAFRLNIDDFAEISAEPPFAGLIEIGVDGNFHMRGKTGAVIVHAHPILKETPHERQVLCVRIDARAWALNPKFDDAQPGVTAAYFDAALILQPAAIQQVAAALLDEGPLDEIRMLDATPAAIRFARKLDIEVSRQRLGGRPIVTVQRILECAP